MKNSENKKIRNDIMLVAAILLIALTAFLIFYFSAEEGSVAVITVDGEIYAKLPLYEDATVEVSSGNGDGYINTVTVKNGEACVSFANCPDNICAEHRAIKNVGETIVCLPHKVVVSIEGEESESAVDTVS